MAKLLSVVVPSYNQGRFLGDNLSAYRGFRNDVELIVLDGGSTDNSVDVIHNHRELIDFWVSEKDGGQASAINSGLARATGTWVCFQNSDDFHIAHVLPELLQTLRSAKEADVVLGGMAFCDADGTVFKRSLPKPIWLPALSRRNFVHNQACFIRRNLVSEIGALKAELRFCLDYEWFVRILLRRPRVSLFPSVVGVQRFHADTKTSQMQDVHDLEFQLISRKYFSLVTRLIGRVLFYPYKAFRFLYGQYGFGWIALRTSRQK